ncbi:MAG: inositol monophosphatase [Firmicutes bacterium]|nr:inositol monophosphatase [Bacillota bacterium]
MTLTHEKIEEIIAAVYEAGHFIAGADRGALGVKSKTGVDNFVTEYDVKTQEMLVSSLGKIIPEAGFLAEENGVDTASSHKLTFIIDPIDATTNFIHDLHHSAVCVGVAEDGMPAAGFVYNPFFDEMFYAVRKEGAYLRHEGGERRLFVSDRALSDALVGFGTVPYDRKEADRTFRIAKEMFLHSREVRRFGSAALDIVYVAAGRFDVFFELCLSPWDFAASSVILTEAGGVIADISGGEISVFDKTSVLATNAASRDEALSVIKSAS